MQGTIIQVSASSGGVPKYAVGSALATVQGLEGDRQNHPQIHGGPFQALLLVSAENLDFLRDNHWPLFPGALGENLTIRGLDFKQIRIGQRFHAGDAILKITKIRQPCYQLDIYGKGIQRVLYDASIYQGEVTSALYGFSGFYASVEREGFIRTNDTIELLDQAV